MLTAVANISDGDATSWVTQWRALAERIRGDRRGKPQGWAPGQCASGVPARRRVLRRLICVRGWNREPRRAADRIVRRTPQMLCRARRSARPAAIPIAIPYEDSDLPGYLFVPADDRAPRPTVILNNGSDGPMTFLWPGLGQPGLDRGYNTVIFDGPGQQSMLFERHVPFRPDWEQVITPLVDFLSDRPEVDASKIVLYGASQAGYWVPRAAELSTAWRHSSPTRAWSTSQPHGRTTSPPSWSPCSTPRTNPDQRRDRSGQPGDVAGDATGVRVARQALRRPAVCLRHVQDRRAVPPRGPRQADQRADHDHRPRRRTVLARTITAALRHGARTQTARHVHQSRGSRPALPTDGTLPARAANVRLARRNPRRANGTAGLAWRHATAPCWGSVRPT